MEGAGTVSVLVVLFLIVAGILAILMPFFVLKIRNELVSINKKMASLIDLLSIQTDSVKCTWCKKIFPSSESHTDQGHTLCPDCWERAERYVKKG